VSWLRPDAERLRRLPHLRAGGSDKRSACLTACQHQDDADHGGDGRNDGRNERPPLAPFHRRFFLPKPSLRGFAMAVNRITAAAPLVAYVMRAPPLKLGAPLGFLFVG
jgi:hypothetical protein